MLRLIKSGSWKIGEQIPSENFLKNHYDVSRLTIRKSLEKLENENLISKRKGSRAKVISRRIIPKVYFSTTLDDPILKKKRKSIVTNFKIKRSITSKKFMEKNVFEVTRFFFDNDIPSFIAMGQVLVKSVPNLTEKDFALQKFNNASLSEILVGKFNFKIHNQKITSSPIILKKEEASFFKVVQKTPGTKWVSFFYDNTGHLLFIDTEISLKNINIELYNKNIL